MLVNYGNLLLLLIGGSNYLLTALAVHLHERNKKINKYVAVIMKYC